MKKTKGILRIFALPVLLAVKSVEVCTKATVAAVHPAKRKKATSKR